MPEINAFKPLLPEISLGLLILSLILRDLVFKKYPSRFFMAGIVLLTFVALGAHWTVTHNMFYGAFESNALSTFFKLILLFSGAVCVLMVRQSKGELKNRQYDFSILLLFAVLGAFFLISSNDLIALFISLEWMTISLYVLASYFTNNRFSLEAGTKYLIVGIFSSAIMLFGISLIYGGSSSIQFDQIRQAVASNGEHLNLICLGLLLLLAGVGFKVSAFPFQFWVPDVYQGAPTPLTAFLSVGSKTAGFAALFKVLSLTLGVQIVDWHRLIAVISVFTLLYGNLGALGQLSIKRLFAYSSIGHAGYLLLGIACQNQTGSEAVLFYLAVYTLANLTVFLVINRVEQENTSAGLISDYQNLHQRSPLLAASFFIALLSLGGIPPLAGFFAKFLIFKAALGAQLFWPAIIGIVAVPISLFYYLNLIREMYFGSTENKEKIEVGSSLKLLLTGLIVSLIITGFFQAPLFHSARTAVSVLF